MPNYQNAAINVIREYATTKITEYHSYVQQICAPFNIDPATLTERILARPVTINFHPDRFSNNGKTILANLLEQGQYHSQFRTGTTNGGTGIHVGGNRFTWEQSLFRETYPSGYLDRPKYGALNIFRYIDGASPRFGSCFFTLKQDAKSRCTFAYGDSSTNPTTLCTSDTFISIVAAMFVDFRQNNRVLNQIISHEQEVLAILLNPCDDIRNLGRNLDFCIETHIH